MYYAICIMQYASEYQCMINCIIEVCLSLSFEICTGLNHKTKTRSQRQRRTNIN